MAEHAAKSAQDKHRIRGAAQAQNPAEIARRELVAWCQAHHLPVPAECRGQSSGR